MTPPPDKIRDDFEKHLEKMWPKRTDPYLRDCNDPFPEHTYQDPDTEFAWVIWQAAYQQCQAEQSDEIGRLRSAIEKTLEENAGLADGDNCTLFDLKQALQHSGEK